MKKFFFHVLGSTITLFILMAIIQFICFKTVSWVDNASWCTAYAVGISVGYDEHRRESNE